MVIAIIAILAAILFPVFARARENARRISCVSNVKQLMLGVLQYTQDYDSHYPGWWVNSTPTWDHPEGAGWWMNQIQPYVKSTQLYACPSDGRPFSPTTNRDNGNQACGYGYAIVPGSGAMGNSPTGPYYKNSYGANEWIISTRSPYNNESAIPNPASTALLAEAIGPLFHDWDNGQGLYGRVGYSRAGAWGIWDDVQNVSRWEKFSGHMQDGNVIGYADGHAKYLKTRQIRWPGDPDPANPQVEVPVVAPFNLPQ